MIVVEIGQWESAHDGEDFRHQSLVLFMYSLYSKFSLEISSVETFIGPRDEENILRLALSQIKYDYEVRFKHNFGLINSSPRIIIL